LSEIHLVTARMLNDEDLKKAIAAAHQITEGMAALSDVGLLGLQDYPEAVKLLRECTVNEKAVLYLLAAHCRYVHIAAFVGPAIGDLHQVQALITKCEGILEQKQELIRFQKQTASSPN